MKTKSVSSAKGIKGVAFKGNNLKKPVYNLQVLKGACSGRLGGGAGNGVWGVANVFNHIMQLVSKHGTGATLNTNGVLSAMGQPCNKANTTLLHNATHILRVQKVLLNAIPTPIGAHSNRVQFWAFNLAQLGVANQNYTTKNGVVVIYNPINLVVPSGINPALKTLITKMRMGKGV